MVVAGFPFDALCARVLRRRSTLALTWSRIRAMNAAFETGSFAAAARRLGVSQPAVAQLVRDIEAEFAVALFDRRGQSLIATQLCHRLHAATNRMQAMETEALAILKQRDELLGGAIRIGLGNAMPGMALIASFRKLYPNIQISVEIGSWSAIVTAVVEQRVDVALLPHVPDDNRFRREACIHQRVVAVCHPTHPLSRSGRLPISELMLHPLVFRTRDSSTQRVVDKAFRNANLRPTPAITINTREGMLEAIANNLGVGFVWEHGSSLIDRIAKVTIAEMDVESPEYIFSLAGKRGKLVELFYLARSLAHGTEAADTVAAAQANAGGRVLCDVAQSGS